MFAPYDHRSITTLYKQLKSKNLCTKEKAELSAHLNYKFAFPILPILIILLVVIISLFRQKTTVMGAENQYLTQDIMLRISSLGLQKPT